MGKAKKGDKVKVHFVGTLEDGEVFESTREGISCCEDEQCCEVEPFELTIGNEDFFPAVEEALIGISPGEKVTVKIPATDAFGEYDPEAVLAIAKSDLPEDMEPVVGDLVVLGAEDEDEEFEVVIIEVSDDSVTFDANHPLAGEDLIYEVELLEIL
ncbi:MAG: FKBP-type peptidyl-prolyl cis-trans isomerase [Trichlorobacter sp.]|jgi:peptidylprolyl isomerase|nr:FKBP-type peptidyl-prolyl cis-trans isomerase [Trichlorobacter sp.]